MISTNYYSKLIIAFIITILSNLGLRFNFIYYFVCFISESEHLWKSTVLHINVKNGKNTFHF
jgi:hypothetical protein